MTTSVFAEHIDHPTGTRHRCVLTDERHLRCLDCDRTLVLPSGVTSTSTSRRSIPNIDDPDRCPDHPGHYAATCGPCRSERLVDEGRPRVMTPRGTDPSSNPDWQRARELLGAHHPKTGSTYADAQEG